jgi:hypothetical protein
MKLRTVQKSLAFALVFASFTASGAIAQQRHRGTKTDEDACKHDVVKYCRKILNQGDMAILSCLQEHRPRLRKQCRAVLERNGV